MIWLPVLLPLLLIVLPVCLPLLSCLVHSIHIQYSCASTFPTAWLLRLGLWGKREPLINKHSQPGHALANMEHYRCYGTFKLHELTKLGIWLPTYVLENEGYYCKLKISISHQKWPILCGIRDSTSVDGWDSFSSWKI